MRPKIAAAAHQHSAGETAKDAVRPALSAACNSALYMDILHIYSGKYSGLESVINKQRGADSTQYGYQSENPADFYFAPPAELKMVVDRAHFKQPFAVCRFKVRDLQHNGKDFTDIDDSKEQNQNRHIQAEAQRAYNAAQKQRTRIPHKYFCRIEIPD